MAEIGGVIGDPARAVMLCALLDGRAHSATELALTAGVSPQTASWHLAKLSDGTLVTAQKQGPQPVFPDGVAACSASRGGDDGGGDNRIPLSRSHVLSEREQTLRTARTCYDHLAGKLGVALIEAFTRRKLIVLSEDGGLVTPRGAKLLSSFGIDLSAMQQSKRPICRLCLDWSEQKPHLAGAVGAALAARCFELDWVQRLPNTRAVAIMPAGVEGFQEQFGVTV